MSEIQAVAFDKDGTLFDSERLYGESLITTCQEMGYHLTAEQCKPFVGLAAEATFARLRALVGAQFDSEKMIRTWLRNRDKLIEQGGVPMMQGAEKIVRYCHAQGYPLALVTSDDHDGVLHDFAYAPDDFLGLFSVVITVDDVAAAKPDPEPYLRAAAYLGVAPQAMLAVEDSQHGAEAALAAGCPLALLPASPPPEHLRAQALKVLQRIDEVEALL